MQFINKAAFFVAITATFAVFSAAMPIPKPQLDVGLGLEIDGLNTFLADTVVDVDDLFEGVGLKKL